MKRLFSTACMIMLCLISYAQCWDNQNVDVTTDWRDPNSISDFNWTVPKI